MIYPMTKSTGWFRASTVVACIAVACVALVELVGAQDNCKMECYPNTKVINAKNGVTKGDNCRWILRTDGKAARLCDHIKCRKVCPNNQAAAAAAAANQDQQSAASDNMRIEQQTEAESPNSATNQPQQQQQQVDNQQPMGIMRNIHGNKLAKAPVPGVAGGKLATGQQQQQQQPQQQPQQGGARRMAPTLPPSVQYDENDTPPPISRFLDISPEE